MELSLPSELSTSIILFVLVDCVHNICFPNPTADLTWELNALSTLCCTSRDFQDITVGICLKIYGPPEPGTRYEALLKTLPSSYALKPDSFCECKASFSAPMLPNRYLCHGTTDPGRGSNQNSVSVFLPFAFVKYTNA